MNWGFFYLCCICLTFIESSHIVWQRSKIRIDKAMVFPVIMYRYESWTIKKGWMSKNWCFPAVMLEKTLESTMDSKEIISVNPKGNQSWIFIGIIIHWYWSWHSNILANWCEELPHSKRPNAGKDWREKEKRVAEDEMVGWHHWLNGHKFEQTLGGSEGQGGLACYSPWGHKQSETT